VSFRLKAILGMALLICETAVQAEDPAARARQAQELVTSGKSEEAIPIYRDLTSQFPRNGTLYLNLSIAEYNAKRYENAANDAINALRLDPRLVASNLFLGASYLELGRYEAALEPLGNVVTANPDDRNARLMLSQALLETGRIKDALESFRISTELLPANPKAWYGLGRVYDALAVAAAEQFQRAPVSAYSLAVAGNTNLDQKRLGSAYEAYSKSLATGPVLLDVCSGLAQIYREIGHSGWIRKECQSTQVSDGQNPAYAAYIGYRRQAREAYSRLERLPDSLELHLHTAGTFDKIGNCIEAAKEWRKSLELTPQSRAIQTGLAWSSYRCRDYETVLGVVGDLLKSDRASANLNFLFGATLLNQQQADRAIPYLTSALKIDPDFVPAHTALGQALLLTGKAQEAIPHLYRGITTDEDGTVHFELLRALQLTKQTERARIALNEYQEFRSAAEKKKSWEDGAEIIAP
jgi:predicted Zn-dependent protease